MFDLPRIQAAIREDGLDGWLLYDFRGLNPIAAGVARVSKHGMGRGSVPAACMDGLGWQRYLRGRLRPVPRSHCAWQQVSGGLPFQPAPARRDARRGHGLRNLVVAQPRQRGGRLRRGAKYRDGAEAAQRKSIGIYGEIAKSAPDSSEAAYARRRLPRLKLGIDTARRAFYCIYD